MNILESLREKAIAWVRQASLEDLGVLPAEVLSIESRRCRVEVSHTSGTRRVLKRSRRVANGHDGDIVRAELTGITPRAPEYKKKRDELSRKLGLSRRQVSALLFNKESWKRRKKR